MTHALRNPRALTSRIEGLAKGIVSQASHKPPLGGLESESALADFPLVAVAFTPREQAGAMGMPGRYRRGSDAVRGPPAYLRQTSPPPTPLSLKGEGGEEL